MLAEVLPPGVFVELLEVPPAITELFPAFAPDVPPFEFPPLELDELLVELLAPHPI